MRIRIAALAVALAAGFGAAAAAPAAEPAARAPLAAAKPCSGSYVHGVLSWGHKCLRAGQFCKRAGDSEYHAYGFHCHKRDSRGNYHLTD